MCHISFVCEAHMFVIKGTLLIVLVLMWLVRCHLVGDKAHLTELKKACEHAYKCFHDTVLVCGKSVHEARTFLDLCDLYEFSCEYNLVYRHVKEDDTCPNARDVGPGYG